MTAGTGGAGHGGQGRQQGAAGGRTLRAAALAAALAATGLGAPGARAEVAVTSGLRVTAEQRFDDGATALEAGGSIGGLLSRLSATGRVGLKGHTFGVGLGYTPSLLVSNTSGSWSLDHMAQLDLSKRLSERVRFEAAAQGWRVTDPTSLPRLGMAVFNEPALYGRADARALADVARRWRLVGAYRFEAARLVRPNRPSDPGFAHMPSLALEHALTPRTMLGLEYRYQGFLFASDVAQAHGPALRLGYLLSRSVGLQVTAGPTFYAAAGARPASGWMPRAAVDLHGEGPVVDWGLSVGHDLVGASGFDAARWATFGAGMLGWQLTRELRLNAAANYFRNGLPPGQGALPWTGAGPAQGVNQGYTVGAGLELRLAPELQLIGSVTRIDQLGAPLGTAAAATTARNLASVRAVWTVWQ